MRVVKYRGSVHGTNENPFLIDKDGISVLPVTSLLLNSDVSSERVSSGIPTLDGMLENKGFYKGSSIPVSGTAGTGKTSIAASFANKVCEDNKKCIYPHNHITSKANDHLFVTGNFERLEQVLMNFVNNAVKYSSVIRTL